MPYFAELNDEKIVLKVIVADSKEWCEENLGGIWIQGHEPLDVASNYFYDDERDVFIPPKPFESWVYDAELNKWNSPIPYPDDDKVYVWNESTQEWDEVEQ
jgi:hypothetical protein